MSPRAREAIRYAVKFLRNVVVLLGISLVCLYGASLMVLFLCQRHLLFIGGRHEGKIGDIYHAVHITEPDGTKIVAWIAPAFSANAPVLVFFYGNAGTLSDFADVGEEFHSQGYGVLLASYRGYSNNSGEPSEPGLYADARATLDILPRGRGKIVLWGQSLGTGIAVRMAAEGRASALVLQSPYTSVVDVAAQRYPIYPVRWLMKDKFDAISLARKIKVPVLIVHGTADEIIPFAIGARLARAFPKVTFVPIPGGSHNLDESSVVPIVQKWFRKSVKMTP